MPSLTPFLQVVCLILAAALAAALRSTGFQLVERLQSIPPGWAKGPVPDPSRILHFKLAVREEKAGQLEQRTLDISTPGNPRYGQHMKRDEIADMMRPAEKVSAEILKWLKDGGVATADIQDKGDWINFDASVEKAEALLNTRFDSFKDESSGTSKIRTLEYSLPARIVDYVQTIQPTTLFGRTTAHDRHIFLPLTGKLDLGAASTHACGVWNTPDCLRDMYNIGNFTAEPGSRNKLGVSGYLDQYARFKDFSLFLKQYVPQAAGTNFSVSLVKDALNLQNSTLDSVEANLDIQYTVALAYNTNVTFYSVGGKGPLVPDLDQPDQESNQNEPYLEQLEYFRDLPDDQLPTVLTTSYGEPEQSVPEAYARQACCEYAKLGARGVTIIFSSGDTGVGSACQTNDGRNQTRFTPIFPASCPFVTSIGGTQKRNPEEAVHFSSGGFSDYWARPVYQHEAVLKYLSLVGDRWQGLYNASGRGFPDIAAQGVSYPVVDKGMVTGVSGTSASAPTIAAIIANLNEIRLSQGKPVLSFINP